MCGGGGGRAGQQRSLQASVCSSAIIGAFCWLIFLVPYVYFVLVKRQLAGIDWVVLSVSAVMVLAVLIYLLLAFGACCRNPDILCVFLIVFPFVQAAVVAQAIYVAIVMYRAEQGDSRPCEDYSSRGFIPLNCKLIRRMGLVFACLACLYVIGLLLAMIFWNTVRLFRNEVLHHHAERKRRAQLATLYMAHRQATDAICLPPASTAAVRQK